MREWNVLVTVAPVPESEYIALEALGQFGDFRRSLFKDVCLGHVADTALFLDTIHLAIQADEPWTTTLSRIIPVETTFSFTPETLMEELKRAARPFIDRMQDGTFYVRLERRGLLGKVPSQEVEQAVADFLYGLAAERGIKLHTDFENADYIVVAETVGDECGVALLPKDLRQKYPFVQPK
jgi:tRNA(Ser,Leu) C12 N-acetylase TAN1